MYLLGFALAWRLAILRAQKLKFAFSSETISDFIFYCGAGGILGGRFGYVLFYELSYFLHHPLSIFATWNGGMSFHGGIIGLIISLVFLRAKSSCPFLPYLRLLNNNVLR